MKEQHKNINEDIQEMPQSRSTAITGHQTMRYEEQQWQNKRHKWKLRRMNKELQQWNHLGTGIIASKTVSHVINSRALTGEKPCINKAIHALLMHGYTNFNMTVPGPQICCPYEMCTAQP